MADTMTDTEILRTLSSLDRKVDRLLDDVRELKALTEPLRRMGVDDLDAIPAVVAAYRIGRHDQQRDEDRRAVVRRRVTFFALLLQSLVDVVVIIHGVR